MGGADATSVADLHRVRGVSLVGAARGLSDHVCGSCCSCCDWFVRGDFAARRVSSRFGDGGVWGPAPAMPPGPDGIETPQVWDDINGVLPPDLFAAGEGRVPAWLPQIGVYEKVDLAQAWAENGRAPTSLCWVDAD